MTAHWGIEDPAAVEGRDQEQAFLTAMRYLYNRISLFRGLSLESLDQMALKRRLNEIGAVEGATAPPTLQPEDARSGGTRQGTERVRTCGFWGSALHYKKK